METQSPETFYEDSDFCLQYEIYDNQPVLHCEVYNWTPSTYKKGLRVFVQMEQFFKNQGYTQMRSISPNPEFCRLFGATSLVSFEFKEKEYEVMVWEL